jgi:dUTP pyrophosphatase
MATSDDGTTLLVQRLCATATLPTRGSAGAAGYDITSTVDVTVKSHCSALISTGIAIAVPAGHYARIAGRSGIALRNSIGVLAGVVDADYRGEVQVLLMNHGDKDLDVSVGDRIAQLILERISTPPVAEKASLPPSVRSAAGFGSTGV